MTSFKVPNKTLTILRGKLPKIITHKWKFGNLLEAPNPQPHTKKQPSNLQSHPPEITTTPNKKKKNWVLFQTTINYFCFYYSLLTNEIIKDSTNYTNFKKQKKKRKLYGYEMYDMIEDRWLIKRGGSENRRINGKEIWGERKPKARERERKL